MQYKRFTWYKLAGLLLLSSNIIAQRPADTLVKLNDAIQLAQKRFHLLQARKFEMEAAVRNVQVAKYSRVPAIDLTYQANLATGNNLTGIFYPYGILPISGPPSPDNNYKLATGSAAGILLNWQAVTFGQRNAQIDLAVAEANTQTALLRQDIFQHTINVISTYLNVLLAYDLTAVQKQNIDRVQANLRQSRVLANTGIKPGVDTALFLSELSKSKIDWLNTQKQLETQQWLLAQLLVTELLPVPADTAFLDQLPLSTLNNDTSFSNHPLVQYAKSQVQLTYSKESLLKKSWLPKLNIWGTAFARGSGFISNGTVKTWDGLGLSRYNYGAGFQLVFPIMKHGEVRRQLEQQNLMSKAAGEKLANNVAALSSQQHIANTALNSSLAVAEESKLQLQSGQYAFNAMQMRYNTGLVNFADLIQAQYNLLKAELDVKKAYWDVWKALLLQAAVKGDLDVFLNEIK